MACAGRVGYRTNGMSSALQLHHLSNRYGQTDGIAIPGVHQRRKPMDHAITDSHTTVTISHRMIGSHRDPPKHAMPRFRPQRDGQSPPRTPCPILARGRARGARDLHVRSVTLDINRPDRDLRPVLTNRKNPMRICSNLSATFEGAHIEGTHKDGRRAQFAERRSLTDRQRSTSRPYASPAAAPSPVRSASMPAATSAAEWSSSSSPAGRTCTSPP